MFTLSVWQHCDDIFTQNIDKKNSNVMQNQQNILVVIDFFQLIMREKNHHFLVVDDEKFTFFHTKFYCFFSSFLHTLDSFWFQNHWMNETLTSATMIISYLPFSHTDRISDFLILIFVKIIFDTKKIVSIIFISIILLLLFFPTEIFDSFN